jgi:hypothetical protein
VVKLKPVNIYTFVSREASGKLAVAGESCSLTTHLIIIKHKIKTQTQNSLNKKSNTE